MTIVMAVGRKGFAMGPNKYFSYKVNCDNNLDLNRARLEIICLLRRGKSSNKELMFFYKMNIRCLAVAVGNACKMLLCFYSKPF